MSTSALPWRGAPGRLGGRRADRLAPLATLALAACLHLGEPPSVGAWTVAVTPVGLAEPALAEDVRVAVEAGLRERGAAGGSAAIVAITRATWSPARRIDDTVVYEARLEIAVQAGGARRSFQASLSRTLLDDGAAASAARDEAFAALAREVGATAAGWLAGTPG